MVRRPIQIVHPPHLQKYQPTKALRTAAREESKEHTKQSKRRKMDPSADRTSLTIQRQQHASNPDLAPPLNPTRSGDRAASYEQLRERLHHRLAQLRSQNGSGSAPKPQQHRPKPQLRPAEPEIPLSLEFGRMKTSADSEPKTKPGARAKGPKTGQLLAKVSGHSKCKCETENSEILILRRHSKHRSEPQNLGAPKQYINPKT